MAGEVEAVTVMDQITTLRLESTGGDREAKRAFLPGNPETILNSISDGFFAVDSDWRIAYINASAEHQFHLSAAQLLGRSLWEVFPAQEHSFFYQAAHRAVESEHHSQVETVFPNTARLVEVHFYPDPTGGLSVYFRDVTERHRLAEELKEREAFYRLLVENASEYAIFGVDLDGVITHWNEGAQRLLGYAEHEVLGRSGELAYTEEDNAAGIFQHEMFLASEHGRAENERWHRRKDGSRFWGSGFLIALRDGETLRGFVKIMRDNTEREATETTLRQYRDIFESTQQGIAIGGPDNKTMTLTNPAYARMHGYGIEELTSKNLLDLYPAREHQNIQGAIQRANETGHTQLETVHLRKDGTEFPVFLDMTAVHDEHGALLYRIVNTTDISRRIAAEKALRQSEEQLHTITENLNIATWNWDPQTDTMLYQRNLSVLFGLDQPIMRMADFEAQLNPEDALRVEAAVQEALSNRIGFDIEFRLRQQSGRVRWFGCKAAPVGDGDDLRLVGVNFEITSRKQVEQAIRESEERFRTMADSAPVFIWMAGPDRQRFYFNQPWLEFTGRALQEARDEGWIESVHFDDLDQCVAIYTEAMEQRQPFQVEFRLRRADGSYRWVLDKGEPRYTPDGQYLGYIGSAVDITEQRETLQREQTARQAAEEASRAKDEFLATISHELRTPLNAILGWTGLLREGALSEDESERALETIERNARAQAQIVEDILDVARIITGKLSLNLKPLDMLPVVQGAIAAVQLSANAKKLTLTATLPTAAPIEGDPTRLQQIVLNLLANAIKFTPPGGKIHLELARRRSQWDLTVTDTGIGIAPDFLEHVFDRFRQADASSTRQHGGLGLGLALVSHLVQGHGGSVSAISEGVGKGATFRVTLPVPESTLRSESAQSGELKTPQQPLAGCTLLAVDDAPDTLDFVAFVLRRAGAEVITARSAAEARQRLLEHEFDSLVCDLGMPEEDGYSLVHWLREQPNPRLARLPVLALTAYAGNDIESRLREASFNAFVAKPFETPEFVDAVKGVLSQPRA